MRSLTFLLLSLIIIPLKSQTELPILAFHGVQSGKTEDFKKLKEAGFNINLGVYYSTKEALRDLDAAGKTGVKLFIYSDSLMLHPASIINRIKDHPSFYGTYVADEPSVKQFPMLRWRISGIKQHDRKGKFYVNLFPNNASPQQLGASSYDEYLAKFVSEVPVDFISFDNYPVQKNKIDPLWYKNLEDIRDISAKVNKPFWGFANSTVFGANTQPTLAELKLQQFGNLLYGAKGLQYFGYWTLDQEFREKNNFKHSVVYEDGTPTPTYSLVQSLNRQIQNLAWIFVNGTVQEIYHDGPSIPIGTRKLKSLPPNFRIFNSGGHSVIVSLISTFSGNFVIIQNKSITSSISLNYKLAAPAKIVDSRTGQPRMVNTAQTSANILPGDILIFNQ